MAQPALRPGIELGRNALQALGMGEGFTHMEWFRQSDGTAVFGEIACRPGGGHMVDLMNYTSDIDLFREWARVACWGHFEAIAPRRYNAAIVFKRAVGQGRITRIVGLREFVHRHRDHVVDVRLAAPGTPRRDWRQTLLSDGYLIIRHPRWDTANAIAAEAAAGITLYAS
jgi:biotin carboxylase